MRTEQIQEIHVGIAEYGIARSPHRLLTLGLGSCVGVALYDPVIRVGGLAHVMLPDSTQFRTGGKPAKFADLAVKNLVHDLRLAGVRNGRVVAKLAGGAQMFFGNNRAAQMAIGERNIEAVRSILKELGIAIVAEDVGGDKGRTISLDTSNGSLTVRTLGLPVRVI
ncbi:chemotaxis protein CheD [Candidatus Desulforudis audaxviator]|nr:chemotaxis protein CheD [Candidatus Desulforudis audaxviator]